MRMYAIRLTVVVFAGAAALAGKPALSQDRVASGPQCTEAGSNFKPIPNLNACARLGLDTTAEIGHQFARYDLHVEPLRSDDGIAFVGYGAYARDLDKHKVIGSVLVRPNLFLFAPTEYGPLSINVRASAQSVAEDLHRVSAGPLFLDDAWASLGPITAGRRFSFFDYNPGFTYKPGYTSYRTTNLIGLTSLIGGIEASLSLEDPSSRRREDGVWAGYAKSRLPDLVGSIRVNGGWGNAFASFALHEVTQMDGLGCAYAGETREMGFAGSAGLEYRQKFGETHGRIMVTGAVADGALDYLGIPRFAPDFIADIDGSLRTARGVSALASYEHVWRPDLRTAFSFSWYGTDNVTSDLRWYARGYLSQFTIEYMPAPNIFVGAEVSHLSDAVKADDAVTDGVYERASMDRVLFYVRRFF